MRSRTARLQRVLVVGFLFATVFLPTASLSQAASPTRTTAHAAAATTDSPVALRLSATLMSTGVRTATLAVTLAAQTAFDEIEFGFDVTPGITVQSSTLPTRTALVAGQPQVFELVISTNRPEPQQVVLVAMGDHNQHMAAEAVRVYVQLLMTNCWRLTIRPTPSQH